MALTAKIAAVSLLCVFLFTSCDDDKKHTDIPALDFRQEMRIFVEDISSYSKAIRPGFIIIPQNGQELLTNTGAGDGEVQTAYVNAIDAVGREDLFYGYNADDQATPTEARNHMIELCDVAKSRGKTVMTTDYCSTASKIKDSYNQNNAKGYISFVADHRELDHVPAISIYGINNNDINSIGEAKNFLYLINPASYASKTDFLSSIKNTNYDIVLIDLFFNEVSLSSNDIESIKTKVDGGKRLVICYMSIGEAENYRYYWGSLDKNLVYKANPDWPGNYIVKYWDTAWKNVIYGNDESYLKKIIDVGFDGVYLDIIEAYETFE